MALRFCANLDWLFQELPLLDRFEAAAKAGFAGVELLVPYAAPAAEIRRHLDETGLTQVLINSPAGDRARGERGMACIPGREEAFRDSVRLALDYAAALDCRLVHLMAGVVPEEVPYCTAAALYALNLAWAAEQAQTAGVRLAIEAINGRDVPGYFLRSQEQAASFATAIGATKVGIQFDIYHCQTAQGDVARRLEALMPLIAHVQVADVPARNEPGTGEIGWEFLFGRIRDLGYAGWIGCEYGPRNETVSGLSWICPASKVLMPDPTTTACSTVGLARQDALAGLAATAAAACRPARSGDGRAPRRDGSRAGSQHARGVQDLHRRRDRQVGQGRHRCEGQARLSAAGSLRPPRNHELRDSGMTWKSGYRLPERSCNNHESGRPTASVKQEHALRTVARRKGGTNHAVRQSVRPDRLDGRAFGIRGPLQRGL